MRKPVRIALAILLVAVLGVFAWQVLRPHEPLYRGKPLSFWLDQMGIMPPGGSNDFRVWSISRGGDPDTAVRQIGTNAVPTLVQLLRAKDSALTRNLFRFLQKHIIIEYLDAERRNIDGERGFRILGTEAEAAVPALINVHRDRISPTSRQCALEAIGDIGPPAKAAIPLLMEVLSGTNGAERGIAFDAIGRIHPEPDAIVPELLKSLHHTDAEVRRAAVGALWSFCGGATQTVPALIAKLDDPDPWVRAMATNALKQIAPEAAAKVGAK